MHIDITGLDRAEVLAALYNGSCPLGLGFLHFDPEPMGAEEARDLLRENVRFDYLKGRVMKIRLKEGETSLFVGLYDRDNGTGAAERALRPLLNSRSAAVSAG